MAQTNFSGPVQSAGGFKVGSVTVIDENGNIDAPVTTTDITASGNTVLGDNALDTVTLNAISTVTTNQKIQFRDTGLYIHSSADGQLDVVADTTLALSGAVTMDSTLDVTGPVQSAGGFKVGSVTVIDENGNIDAPVTTTDLTTSGNTTLGDSTSDITTINGKINLAKVGSAAASASGLLMGVGTTVAPASTSIADAKFVELRTKSTATSGDSRGIYLRHELAGAGVSGESIRNFTKVTGAVATARGTHNSLDIDVATGSVSGLGVGNDAQILVGDGALTGGTYTGLNSEIYSAGDSTDVSGVTDISFFRCSAGGNATGAENVDDKVNFVSFSGVTAGSGNMINTDITTHTAYGGLRVYIPGVGIRYLALVSA